MTTSTSPHHSSLASHARTWGLVVALLGPATALAGKKEDAKAYITRAARAHKEGRYQDARVELEAAYALDPKPDLLYAIGQVDAKLGDCDEATTYYRRFAATQSDPQVARVVDQAIAACKPAPEAAAEQAPDSESPDRPAPTENTPPVADLPAPAEPPAATQRKPSPASRAQPFARPRLAPAPVGTRQRSPWYQDGVGDALVVGGVVATVIGLVEYGGALSELDTAGDRGSTTTLGRFHERVDSAHHKRTASIVLAGAGGGLIGAGILHYVLHIRTTETRGVGVAPARSGGVITYGGRF